ncbi:MAG: hypothetical protein ACJAYB_001542 [Psychromonas sp.]|jgi:hypothetical protein
MHREFRGMGLLIFIPVGCAAALAAFLYVKKKSYL